MLCRGSRMMRARTASSGRGMLWIWGRVWPNVGVWGSVSRGAAPLQEEPQFARVRADLDTVQPTPAGARNMRLVHTHALSDQGAGAPARTLLVTTTHDTHRRCRMSAASLAWKPSSGKARRREASAAA